MVVGSFWGATMRPSRKKQEIVILCEGSTEEYAIRYFVRRQWEVDGFTPMGLHTIDLRGKVENVAKYARLYAREEQVTAVFTLIDLYGTKQIKYDPRDDLAQKVTRAKTWLQQGISPDISSKFYPHFSVHEVEAWLLADGRCLANRLKNETIQPDPQAETRNFENPPSRRLQTLFKQHKPTGYSKIQDGIPLFQHVTFETVYASCVYFRTFYDDLKQVAQHHL